MRARAPDQYVPVRVGGDWRAKILDEQAFHFLWMCTEIPKEEGADVVLRDESAQGTRRGYLRTGRRVQSVVAE